MASLSQTAPRFRAFGADDLTTLRHLAVLRPADLLAMRAVAAVWPFRVNAYVLDQLIDWSRIPEDPIYQLTFPQPGMLAARDLTEMTELVAGGASPVDIRAVAARIQLASNPHPAQQLEKNVPLLQGRPVQGVQHKYRETVLFFPAQGQTCHAYCTYCFRWAQFVGMDELRFAATEADDLVGYLQAHPEVTNVLITGGDPLIMRTAVLARYIEPLLAADLPDFVGIRIGTKAPAYWPYRFLSDGDADELLRLFDRVVARGYHLGITVHYSHPAELSTMAARDALARIRSTGAVVRTQAPVIRHVNDAAEIWETLWRQQVRLGAVPYYMFVERDTGPRGYFEVPLARAHQIFRDAYSRVNGLARTVRGPSMSTAAGKVVVDGVIDVSGEPAFALRYLQARDPDRVGRPFLARFDPRATWFDQLKPRSVADAIYFGDGAAAPRFLR
jgi:KamA family protein